MSKPRPTLGVVAVSLNEERDLPGFIEHLLDWVDEIVIVDDGSTDQTAPIACRYGAKIRFTVSPRTESEGWAGQRNKGIALATSDWLLHMDIDERVPASLANEIRMSIAVPDRDAYRYRRLNFLLHRPMRGGGWERWNNVQLARREVLKFDGVVHERAELNCPPSRIGQLQELMWHLNDESWAERMRKSARYAAFEGERIAKRGNRVRWFHFVTRPLWMFFKTYVLLRGYRDGIRGLILAMHNFGAVFHWHAIAWDLQNPVSREGLEAGIRQAYISEPRVGVAGKSEARV